MIAIDIDGTLTAYPRILAELIRRMPCMLLTGGIADDPDSVDLAEWVKTRRQQVRDLFGNDELAGVEIVTCPGRTGEEVAVAKGVYCRDHAIDVLIDDSPGYCAAVRRLSPRTLVLQVIT